MDTKIIRVYEWELVEDHLSGIRIIRIERQNSTRFRVTVFVRADLKRLQTIEDRLETLPTLVGKIESTHPEFGGYYTITFRKANPHEGFVEATIRIGVMLAKKFVITLPKVKSHIYALVRPHGSRGWFNDHNYIRDQMKRARVTA